MPQAEARFKAKSISKKEPPPEAAIKEVWKRLGHSFAEHFQSASHAEFLPRFRQEVIFDETFEFSDIAKGSVHPLIVIALFNVAHISYVDALRSREDNRETEHGYNYEEVFDWLCLHAP